MGVRGLTGYIARHADQYLVPFELHDCNLVIDGDNLACNLYKDVCGTYSAFGGDYDDFFRCVVEFFHVLAECNVHAFVLMDGGYEVRKLRTVGKRLRGKISVIKRINPCGSVPVFPLMMKEVFIDAVRSCNVPVMRCLFEADDELAALSRKLNCPVLSYDSDFYIHNVRYIPLITLTMKAHTKRVKSNATENRKLRKNEAKHVEKLTKSNRIIGKIQVDNVEKKMPKGGRSYKYLDCCIYRIDNLIARRSLSKEKLPLFAALLGNDYIARSSFRHFFAVGMGKVGRSRKLKQQQRRIRLILQWLKEHTAESALEKIVARLKKNQRESLLAQVNAAICGYSNEKCHSYDFFKENFIFENLPIRKEEMDNDELELDEEDSSAEEVFSCEDAQEEESEEEEEEDHKKNVNKNFEGLENEGVSSKDNSEEENIENNDNDNDSKDVDDVEDKREQFPEWFLEKLYSAHLPRFFVDLLHLKKYINSPQIEHFPYNDCNEIALPILIYICSLLNSADSKEKNPSSESDTSSPIGFTYLTRATRITNIRYYHYSIESPPKYAFNPHQPNPLLFRQIFEGTMCNFDSEKLFKKVMSIPKDLQLYFLAIVYWLQNSQHCDFIHLNAILVCIVVLRTIDSKIPAERDLKMFGKRFGKMIKKEKFARSKENLEHTNHGIKEDIAILDIPERMKFISKSDCYLVQDNLLKYFRMQEIFKKKYDLYSTVILHAFAEFQSVIFQMHSLNALLDFPFERPHMGQLFCGVLLYNLYDVLHMRFDIRHHVKNFLFQDSQLMFDFYCYLLEWCIEFVPPWKMEKLAEVAESANKKRLKKRRKEERRKAEETKIIDPNAEIVDVSEEENADIKGGIEKDDFFDLNNKFCALLKVR